MGLCMGYSGTQGAREKARKFRLNAAVAAIYIFFGQLSPVRASNTDQSIGYWKFDEAGGLIAADSSPTGNHGTLQGSTTWVSGKIGSALSFDGVTGFVQVGTDLSQWLGGTASLSAWIKTTQLGKADFFRAPGIAGVESSGNNNDIFWGWIDATGRIGLQAGNGDTARSTNPINDGQWHHIGLTRDATSGQVKVYVDGVLNATTLSETGSKTTQFRSLGRIENTGGAANYLQGQLDEVSIYNFVLSAADIQALAGAAQTNQPPQPPTGVAAFGGNGQVTLTWNSSASATSYNVWRLAPDGSTYLHANASPVTSTVYTNTGLVNGTTYSFVITAVGAFGESGYSQQVSAAPSSVPSGFGVAQVGFGLTNPTEMEIAPDGRIFIAQEEGTIRVIKNDALLSTPVATLTGVDDYTERGLLGLTLDPNFSANHFLYVYYTAGTNGLTTSRNRISRLTLNGDVAVPGSEIVLFELPPVGNANLHMGGAIHFGADGKLYISVGDFLLADNSQSLTTATGKILRLNSDGSIPTDNPFYNTPGAYRAIWAYGLRNPFTSAFQPGTGRFFINDVGKDAWEEIDNGIAGANYGWPTTEGFFNQGSFPNFTEPIYVYPHTEGCAITGGTFYNPPTQQFPAQYVGKYFFQDFCNAWVRMLNPADNSVTNFATFPTDTFPTDMRVSPDGSLYILSRASGGGNVQPGLGGLYKIQYLLSAPPVITLPPVNQLVSPGNSAAFHISASGTQPLNFQWQRNSVNIPTALTDTYSLPTASLADNGAQFRCLVSNTFGSVTSSVATLTVIVNQPPVATITAPPTGTFYNAGDTINFAGTGTDPEDGNLPASNLTWQIDFQHDAHAHPFFPPTSGITNGTFIIPTTGETSPNVWFRIYLTAKDSLGATNRVIREIFPHTATVTLQTSPAGLQVKLDGSPTATATSIVGVVGLIRSLEAFTQTVANVTYVFDHWSDAGAASHNILFPSTATTYTAFYHSNQSPAIPAPPTGVAALGIDGQVILNWNASAGALSYNVWRSTTDGSGYSQVNAAPVTSTAFTNTTGLANGTTYYLVITAVGSGGESGFSQQVSALPLGVPTGFGVVQVAAGLSNPTQMEFTPDGRILIAEEDGTIRLVKNDALLPGAVATLTNVDAYSERGLLGITPDPGFATNQYLYLYYTAGMNDSPTSHNRISRLTLNGDVAVPGSEAILFELPAVGSAEIRMGGAIHFGPDGKLYISVGDWLLPANSQSLTAATGKILRLNADGSIPTDNPFYNTPGAYQAIWAYGFRNPYTSAFQPGTGRFFINDVGQSSWEEINNGVAGANYGWPTTEGTFNQGAFPNFTEPVYAYSHSGGCAITGGTFYNPPVQQFPAQYVGKYFFQDFCYGWIRMLNPADNSVANFASFPPGTAFPTDIKTSPGGSLYILCRGAGTSTPQSTLGRLYRIQYLIASPLSITLQPTNQLATVGQSASFHVSVSGTPPISFRWQRNAADIPNATTDTYTLPAVSLTDNGAQFRCIASNAFGSATSSTATLTVISNQPPVATITAPQAGTFYNAGDTINFAGAGVDPQDGNLPAANFTWQVDFQHDTQALPFFPATSGITNGTFVIPTTGETSPNVWYRIYLTVHDSFGLTNGTYREIFPNTATITLQTSPAGLQVKLDGSATATATSIIGVVGLTRSLEAFPQAVGNTSYLFDHWSDSGASVHNISFPSVATTYTAFYRVDQPPQATITNPPASTLFNAGDIINFAGTGTDTEDGNLSANALTWEVDVYHNGQPSLLISPTNGITAGSFIVPTTISTDVWYRISLTAVDSKSQSNTVTSDLLPRTATISFQTSPTGRSISVDGTNYSATTVFTWVAGSSHAVATTSPQSGGSGVQYVWSNWSDGGALSHSISPTVNTTYTANFAAQYFLTMNAGAGGTTTPTSGWYNSGVITQLTATANAGYTFTSWAGSGSGAYSGANNPASATINGPITETASFTPIPPPVISYSPSLLNNAVTQGQNAGSQTIQVWNSGGTTLSYSILTNVPWLSVSLLSGNSAGETNTHSVTYSAAGLATGTYSTTITIASTNASNSPQSIPVSLIVSPPTSNPTPPIITADCPLPNGTVGSSYSVILGASGGTTPYNWSLSSGSLPSGLSLNSNAGIISGTPTTADTQNFTIRCTGATSLFADKACSITITNIVPRYSLSAIVNPLSGGNVAATPPAGADGKYLAGTPVTLTAQSAPCYSFLNWLGDATGSNASTQVTVDHDTSVTATFLQQRFSVEVLPSPLDGGNITVNPPPDGDGLYVCGTAVTLAANPASNFFFNAWTGDATGDTSPLQLSVNGNRNVTANFGITLRYALSIAASPSSAGSVTANPHPDLDGKYANGTMVTIAAHPNKGSKFGSWAGDANGTNATTSVVMNGSRSAAAQFVADPTIPNSPVGKWEVAITRANKGAAFITFQEDFTWSGVGLRGAAYGLCELTGTWSFASSGKRVTVTGAGSEMVNSNHTWDATINARGKARKRITALVRTDTGAVFKWSGKPGGSPADLSGQWTGQISTKSSITAADYVLVKDSGEPGLFEIRDSSGAVPSGTVVGEAIVTSKNKLVVYVKQNGRNCVLTGRYAPRKRRMRLSGHDEFGQPVSIMVN